MGRISSIWSYVTDTISRLESNHDLNKDGAVLRLLFELPSVGMQLM